MYRCYTRNFVRAYTHTLRLHMMCTPFLVYTYAFTYDENDILVYVCHSDIVLHGSLLCDCLFPFLFSSFSFRCMQTVYTDYLHSNCLEFHWNMTYGTWLPGYWTFQQIYIRYILHIDGNSDIFISRGWYSEVYAFYSILILYDCALMSTHFHCICTLYTVYTVC